MRSSTTLRSLLAVAVLALGIAAACSDDAAQSPAGDPTAAAALPSSAASPGSDLGDARLIELEETGDLRIVQDGEPVTELAVTPGETIRFVVTNTAGFAHDFYIGPDDRLATNRVDGLAGLDSWSNREPRQFDWIVPDDVEELRFGCSIRGHYPRMSGSFSST